MEKQKTIGVLLSDESKQGLMHDYFASILESFRLECNKMGYSIAFLNHDRNAKGYASYAEQAEKANYAGVLIACIEEDEEVQELTAKTDIVVAVIDKSMENCISICSDNDKGMEHLTRYLLEMGHRRIAFITGDDNDVSSIRLNGFLRTCEGNDIPIPKEYILRGKFRDMQKTAYFTERLLQLANPPSCIIYPDDYAAIGGINTITARGLIIPNDISIAGYDGNDILSQIEPRLTTVIQDTNEMGRLACEKMIYHIENPEDRNYGAYKVDVIFSKGRTVGKIYE